MPHSFNTDSSADAPDSRRVTNTSALGSYDVLQARVDLAACFRMAANLGMDEGICNAFSAVVPGYDTLFPVDAYGLVFSEVAASIVLVCDCSGHVFDGDGVPEATAFFIHHQIHKHLPRAQVALHAHMPYATALTMIDGDPLVFVGQTALKFYRRTAVDRDYNGLALCRPVGRAFQSVPPLPRRPVSRCARATRNRRGCISKASNVFSTANSQNVAAERRRTKTTKSWPVGLYGSEMK